jgi:hypothetical protein
VEVDTRIPWAGVRWITIGKASVWYEKEWWFSVQILFYRKTMRFSDIKPARKKIREGDVKKKRKKKVKLSRMLKKMIRVIRTFRVTEWQLAVDTGDYTLNAQLYPLNYLPYAFEHLDINFRDTNFLVLKIRNRPWKILRAFLR